MNISGSTSRYRILLALAIVSLSGCASFSQLDDGLNALVGKPLSTAVDTLGVPNGERVITGRHYVQWGRTSAGFMPMPTNSYTYGTANVGSSYGNYSATTLGTIYVPVSYNCTVTLTVDSNERISDWSYDGNLGGCAPYIERLKNYRKAAGSR